MKIVLLYWAGVGKITRVYPKIRCPLAKCNSPSVSSRAQGDSQTATRAHQQSGSKGLLRILTAAPAWLLHLAPADERHWRYLIPVLALAFVARAVIALSGDFAFHADEIMQYLEPAHRLVFGNGAIFWEYHYGARSWLTPGFVATVLKLLEIMGLDRPFWYVGAVELMFCAISLLIPAGMYFFAREHFGEITARVAVVAGAFWYELVVFAHKPMTEFTATALLLALLAVCSRPNPHRLWVVLAAGLLAVLAAAVRLQYTPIAFLILGIFFLRTDNKIHLSVATISFAGIIGIFDALTWNGGLFHSYILNTLVNLAMEDLRTVASPPWQFLHWIVVRSTGLAAICLLASLQNLRRYGFLLALIALTLLIHSLQAHKEYRFIFVVIPLWLLIGADIMCRLVPRLNTFLQRKSFIQSPIKRALLLVGAGIVFATIPFTVLFNLPLHQFKLHQVLSGERSIVELISNHDPIFSAYRYLADSPDVEAVWQADRSFSSIPGYYYLHHSVPIYTLGMEALLFSDQERPSLEELAASVTHVVSRDPSLAIPGYVLEEKFGDFRILAREAGGPPIRQWVDYTPTMPSSTFGEIASEVHPRSPKQPPNFGIRFKER